MDYEQYTIRNKVLTYWNAAFLERNFLLHHLFLLLGIVSFCRAENGVVKQLQALTSDI